MTEFMLEEDVNRYVMQQLESLGLKQHSNYHIESATIKFVSASGRFR